MCIKYPTIYYSPSKVKYKYTGKNVYNGNIYPMYLLNCLILTKDAVVYAEKCKFNFL